jgi:hypothetical protein
MGNMNMAASATESDRRYLHTHRLLMRLGFSMAMMFAWIFTFQYFLSASDSLSGAFIGAITVYALSQAIMMLLTPFSAAHLRHGVKRSMVFGSCVAAAALIVLGGTFAGYFSDPQGWGILLFGFLLGAYRALYWIPYRLQAAHASSGPNAFYEFLVALMPAFAGATLTSVALGPLRLLFGAAAFMLFSIIPLFPLEDIHERFSWSYGNTFRKLFDERNRVLASRAVLDGIESTALFLLWPLSVFLIVGRSYIIMGLIMSTSLVLVLLLRGFYRRTLAAVLARRSVALDVAFSMSGWILRLAAGTPLAVVFADSYSYVSAPFGAPEVLSSEHTSDAGSYLDEYTALQEIGLGLGRIVMCAFAGLLILFAPLPVALALSLIGAAVSAGFAAYLAHGVRASAY